MDHRSLASVCSLGNGKCEGKAEDILRPKIYYAWTAGGKKTENTINTKRII